MLIGRGQPHAAEQAQRERDVGNQQQPQPDAGDGACLLDLGAAQALGLAGELLERVLAAAEGLEHADAVHRLLDGGREVALLVLRAARHDRVLLLEDEAVDPQRDRADEEDQAEHPAPEEQHDESDQDRDGVDHEQHDAEGQPAADQARGRSSSATAAARSASGRGTRPAGLAASRRACCAARPRRASRGQHEPAARGDQARPRARRARAR